MISTKDFQPWFQGFLSRRDVMKFTQINGIAMNCQSPKSPDLWSTMWLDWFKGKFTGNHRFSMIFPLKSLNMGLSCRFSLKPIHWQWGFNECDPAESHGKQISRGFHQKIGVNHGGHDYQRATAWWFSNIFKWDHHIISVVLWNIDEHGMFDGFKCQCFMASQTWRTG